MSLGDAEIWLIIALVAVGTFLIRFSFIGLIGDRQMPELVLRLLRYTPVAVIPGLVAPLVVWPEATGGSLDPVRIIAAAATLGVGLWSKSMMASIFAGAIVFYGLGALLA
ncbi:MAG: AzlD domain-containing protein [Rhodobacteraceae bacterium]|jgi:branched-subunit amino acid transport protein|nr:AzlD domain-containing protein [Alphaproteobacteria bacterium]MBT8476351.1 AzlD domain-containing protein [Alphaproteobacteria bacterium]NNK68162.1 AzlD domain-containing protein [Paracoccaceae bacterium]